ncbi:MULTISPECIES: autoinducer binding domain-containing protein [Paraburkholderia]|uniref:autoinducer binding domain-containing protein n=1 Tax=Paraburkholderia TaxID=1822464 RepID=UPI0022559807|nr:MULTISPECIES: autoinducer binding domain-containing protein [Paraburkholderia]MCX4166322.1 autoinducer binding domain-containing protein [Paraburkholderia megapolitana]MDN7161812.1 autoinducer binding domain-containing protein [Paraburkholderia sp. CHISQ3]MDQ6498860.1 autoinducer binding domain-containing protein [Paraburkholderia megapolitana]
MLAVLIRAAQHLGFDHAAYGIRYPVPITKPQIIMTSTYPDEWKARYFERQYIGVDPTVKNALATDSPVAWTGNDTGKHGSFWDEASSFGIVHGWSAASRGADGTVGLLTLARNSCPISPGERISNEAVVILLSQAAHAIMAPRLTVDRFAEGILTAREIDVLKWTADGKTAYEIAKILIIAECTVNFHIKNIVAKLGCANKIQAAAKAALIGLLR